MTDTFNGMRVISYGGGVQSTAMIVLAVQGRIGDHPDDAVRAVLVALAGGDQ